MRIASYVIGAVILGVWLVTWIGGRLNERLHDQLAVVRVIATRILVSVLLLLIAAGAAMHGGYAWLLVPVLVFVALFGFALSGLWIWTWATRGFGDDDPSGGD
jgi:hypothetical protein